MKDTSPLNMLIFKRPANRISVLWTGFPVIRQPQRLSRSCAKQGCQVPAKLSRALFCL